MTPGNRNLASILAGAIGLAGLAIVMAGALGALALTAVTTPGGGLWDDYLWRVVRFTLLQAALSAALSIGLAIPVARAISRRRVFPGRGLLLRLFALPLALPALVVVLGIVDVWGRHGWVSAGLRALGLSEGLPAIYGLGGILLAHVFFNLPLAARLMIMHLERIPGETWRLSSQLGMKSPAIFRFIEWPALRAGLPGIAGLVFMLCIASFTVVLTLGGGPAATTIEVAIYQALRFDFDPGRAVILALVQLGMTAALIALGMRLTMPTVTMPSLNRPIVRPDCAGLAGRIGDGVVIALAALFVILPLLALAVSALAAPMGKLLGEAIVRQALLTSLAIGTAAAVLCVVLAWSLLIAAHAAKRTTAKTWRKTGFVMACESGGSLILVMPPIFLGAGWFVLLHGFGEGFALAPIVVITINGLMALPYTLRILGPAHASAAADHDRLCDSLGMSGWSRWRLADWPVLRPAFGVAFAFAMALSLGDLGAVALFGSEDLTTLPLLILQRMGSYRTADAAGLAFMLAIFCLILIISAERATAKPDNGR